MVRKIFIYRALPISTPWKNVCSRCEHHNRPMSTPMRTTWCQAFETKGVIYFLLGGQHRVKWLWRNTLVLRPTVELAHNVDQQTALGPLLYWDSFLLPSHRHFLQGTAFHNFMYSTFNFRVVHSCISTLFQSFPSCNISYCTPCPPMRLSCTFEHSSGNHRINVSAENWFIGGWHWQVVSCLGVALWRLSSALQNDGANHLSDKKRCIAILVVHLLCERQSRPTLSVLGWFQSEKVCQ